MSRPASPPPWQVKRRTRRREALVTGTGFHAFAGIPKSWSGFARCSFCRRGERDKLDGLWDCKGVWVCTDCAHDILDGKMPTGWVDAGVS